MAFRGEFVTTAHQVDDISDASLQAIEQAHQERFKSKTYWIREKHLTIGSQAWVTDETKQSLVCFAKETGSYSRSFCFYSQEPEKKAEEPFGLFYVQDAGKAAHRALVGADFTVLDWRRHPLFHISRKIVSLNRRWVISDAAGAPWGEAHEGGGTALARRIPFVSDVTVLSMQVHSQSEGKIADFKRKRLSLGDSYELKISSATADRRLLIGLGVLFETIHD